jgi:hypothetical protein
MALRTLFLSIHVFGGGLGLLLGAFAMRPPDTKNSRLPVRLGYAAALVILVGFLYATLAVDWPGLAPTSRIVFAVLAGLGAFILVRLSLAFRISQQRSANWQTKYINHVYFTYISLWEGFFIVGLIDLGAPSWLVASIAVGVLVVGGYLSNRYKRKVVNPSHPEQSGRPSTPGLHWEGPPA